MSGRRGVHHSGGLRAKRRWLKWRRYQERCDVLAGYRKREPWGPLLYQRWAHRSLEGYYRAGARWTYVGRYASIGIRDVRP